MLGSDGATLVPSSGCSPFVSLDAEVSVKMMVRHLAPLLVMLSTSLVGAGEEPMYEDKPLSYWINVFQQSESPRSADWKAAPTALRTIGEPAVEALIGFLRHEDATTRARSAGALLGMDPKPTAAVPELIRALKDPSKYVRYTAPQVLAEIGPDAKAAVPALIEALKDSEAIVRAPVAIALGSLGTAAKDAVPALTEALQDEDRHVRREAAVALEKIEGE